MVAIDQKRTEVDTLAHKITELENQITRADEEISAKQAALGTAILEGANLDKLTRAIQDLGIKRDGLEAAIQAASQKLSMLQHEIWAAGKAQALQRSGTLEQEYRAALLTVMRSLAAIWKAGLEIRRLYAESERAARRYDIPKVARISGVQSGSGTFVEIADRALTQLEQRLPDLFKASGCPGGKERVDKPID